MVFNVLQHNAKKCTTARLIKTHYFSYEESNVVKRVVFGE